MKNTSVELFFESQAQSLLSLGMLTELAGYHRYELLVPLIKLHESTRQLASHMGFTLRKQISWAMITNKFSVSQYFHFNQTYCMKIAPLLPM